MRTPGPPRFTSADSRGGYLYVIFMGTYPFSALDHVHLAMPPEGEGLARAFYGTLLGMREVPKPAELAKRGGCWFECGPVQVHLGVEADFRPARKAHPALRCFDYDGLVSRLKAAGVEVTDDASIPGAALSYHRSVWKPD
jgi:hypothetical protein